jgi:hypothetical protein
MTLRSCELDVRVGGGYRLVFGVDPANTMAFFGKYLEVVPPSRLVWTNEESGEGGVELARQRGVRRLLVEDARSQRFVGTGESLDGGEDIGIHGGGLCGAEFSDGKGQRGHKLLLGVDNVLRNFFIE